MSRRGTSSSPEADRDVDTTYMNDIVPLNEKSEDIGDSLKEDDENDMIQSENNHHTDSNNKYRESILIGKDDAAFILGTRGSTKRKVSRVCGAFLELIEANDKDDSKLEIEGTPDQIALAKDYVRFITQQRVGPVQIDISLSSPRNDLTVVDVPDDCVGFVMGRGGSNLRSMEEEWGSLMFFAQVREEGKEECEKLCIFGSVKARRGAELKVMSAVEYKKPGHFVRGETLLECRRVQGDVAAIDWSTDTMLLNNENFKYALGAKGATRRKLAAASGCIIEYVGHLACICGNHEERARARDYIKWLIAQRTGTVSVDITGRSDVSVVQAPSSTIGYITGFHGESLRRVEKESGTFCFTDAGTFNKEDTKEGYDKVLIFSDKASSRDKATRILNNRISEHQSMGSRPVAGVNSGMVDGANGGKGVYDRYGDGGGGYGGKGDRSGYGGDRYGGKGDRSGYGGDRYGGKGDRSGYGGDRCGGKGVYDRYEDGGGGYGGKGDRSGYGGDRYGGKGVYDRCEDGGGGYGGKRDRYGGDRNDRPFDRRIQRPDYRGGNDRSRSRERRRS